MKKVAVKGCTITYSIQAGTVSITGSVIDPSSDVSSQNKTAFKDKITITVTAGSVVLLTPPAGAASPNGTLVVGGTIEIAGTSNKSSTDGKAFVVEGDEGSKSFTFSFPQMAGPLPITQGIEVTAKVTNAGQNVLNVT